MQGDSTEYTPVFQPITADASVQCTTECFKMKSSTAMNSYGAAWSKLHKDLNKNKQLSLFLHVEMPLAVIMA